MFVAEFMQELLFVEWLKIVEKNIDNLSKEDTLFCWPKDSLFRYFLIMEALMDNLKEREKILHSLGKSNLWTSIFFVCVLNVWIPLQTKL